MLIDVKQFETLTGEQICVDECIGVLTRQAFESLYANWLQWEIVDPGGCAFWQLSGKSFTQR
ncbi:MAG: hypothetical protein PHY23_00230 [Oscillospiraceae bacterium]|nr:hypothetical protein [Oscillospiraceae bacterium]